MQQTSKFTIVHGFIASIVVHSALALPLIIHGFTIPPEEPSTLVVDLEGFTGDNQSQEKVLQEIKGEAKQQDTEEKQTQEANETPPPPEEPPPPEKVEDEGLMVPPQVQPSPPPTDTKPVGTSANDVAGVEERQIAQTIKAEHFDEADRLKAYGRKVSKKVQTHLVYPEEGRQEHLQGSARVSFTVQQNGEVRLETLKVVQSSGQAKLDASALQTIRASVPFDPPPREMTIAITVDFGKKT